jgi:midasin (ATPase involved in ribosome maturation)
MNFVPEIDSTFIECDVSEKIEKIISSGLFFPFIVFGETGTGKTFPVLQICAKLNRECIRLNFSKRTNEDNLIGSFRLVNGETVFEKGPVIIAMERGAVLLLDEIDAADPEEVLCLQSIMEGSGYFIKAINEKVNPHKGFTIIATANTKGLGDDTGKYIGTNILNEAFLERFIMILTAKYLSKDDEEKILIKNMEALGIKCLKFIKKLVLWSDKIRETISKDPDQYLHNISTRRLIHILSMYKVFGNEKFSVRACLNRFDDYHSKAFMDFYEACFIDEEDEPSSPFINDFKKLQPIKG